jgi:hypothetical protein
MRAESGWTFMLRSLLALAVALVLAPAVSPQPVASSTSTSLHVATWGNDRNPGTSERPLATLQAARNAVRTLRAHGLPQGGVTVWIHGGLYLLDGGFSLNAEDSGEPGKPVVYSAAPGEHPRLFGGVRLDPAAFTPVNDQALLARLLPEARGHIVQFHLPEQIGRPVRYPEIFKGNGGMVQLIRDGALMPLSRWPNSGYTTMASVTDSGITPPHGGTFHYRDEVDAHVARWIAEAEAGNLWLTGFWRVPFETESVRVQSINLASRTITLAVPVPNGIGSKYVAMVNGTRPGNGEEPYFAFNLVEEIGHPGEWAYDFHTDTLYFWPPATAPSQHGELLLANLGRPVVSLNSASYVVLRGLEVEGGLMQGIAIGGGSNNLVAGCTVRMTGGGGIDVEGGAQHRIQSNDLERIGSYGIRMVAGDRARLVPAGLVADNNHIHHFGLQERITEGIYLGGVGNRATHNLIHDAPYNGIVYQGNDQVMAYNEIHHIGLDAGDLGIFYTNGDWAAQGNVVAYNFGHDAPNANGSYIDDGASGRTTVGNIFYNLASGILLGGGHNNRIENNLFIACKIGIHVDNRGVARHYDSSAHHLTAMLKTIDPNLPPWSTRYPHFLDSILADPTEPTGNIIARNILIRDTQPYRLAAPSLLDPKQNPVFEGNPRFTDEAARNLNVPADSPLYQAVPGFHAIPFAAIGLKLDEYRTALPESNMAGRSSSSKATQSFDSDIDIKASDRQGSMHP